MKKIFLNINTIIFLALLVRMFVFFVYADTTLENEWGILAHNLYTTGVFGLYVVDGNIVKQAYANFNSQVLPSAFMPPLYGYFIYLIKLIFSNFFDVVKIILIIQIILNLFSINLFFNLIKKYFSFNVSFFSTMVFALIPINIYASVQISSITFQLFLLLFFLYFFSEYFEKFNIKSLVFISIFSGLLVLIRAEFFIFYLLTLLFLFLNIKLGLKKIILSFVIFLLILSPYVVRNYLVFNDLLLTKSFGYNLLKGNNPDAKVEGNIYFIENKIEKKNLDIKIDNRYEINLDNFYREKAFKYISENPSKFLKLYIYKFFSFLFIDLNSDYPNYYNLAHIIPKILISILSFISAINALKSKSIFKYLSLFYFSHIFLFSIFFILPRYSLMLLPLQLLLILKFFFDVKK